MLLGHQRYFQRLLCLVFLRRGGTQYWLGYICKIRSSCSCGCSISANLEQCLSCRMGGHLLGQALLFDVLQQAHSQIGRSSSMVVVCLMLQHSLPICFLSDWAVSMSRLWTGYLVYGFSTPKQNVTNNLLSTMHHSKHEFEGRNLEPSFRRS